MFFISTTASSQNIQTTTIEWNCSSTFDASKGVITDETTKIVSSVDQIVWYDSNGVARKTLTITDKSGSWNNVSANGSIDFNITSGNQVGIVQFFRTGGIARVRIHLVESDESQIYEMVVDNLRAL